jgi:hypothetical protein
MIARRKLIMSGAAAMLAAIPPRDLRAADDPAAILTAIYTRVTKGKGDGGGTFVIDGKAARAKYLSDSLATLWNKADARTRKGDGGPVGFDPVTNSQDPDVKSFKVAAGKQEVDKATMTVTIEAHQRDARANAADKTIRYDFVREAGQWKIDEIKGAVDGTPWSVRALLVDSSKY